MSFADGWAALHLDMPARVPRTEYSAEMHWELMETVTGVPVGIDSPESVKSRARQAFYRAWNYDLFWSTLIGGAEFGDLKTDMGHAVYAAGGTDYRPVGSCRFETPDDVLEFDFAGQLGVPDHRQTVARFEAHYHANQAGHPDGVNMTGVYITLVSGLIDLFGWDMLLLAAGTDPQRFGALADRYAQWMQHYFNALADADVPVVMVHDDIVWTSGAFIHPDWYRQHVFPHYARYFAPVRDSGKIILFTSDGNYTAFIDDIAACGIHGFVLEPTTDMAYIAEQYGRTHAFIGNVDTRVLLGGDKTAIRAEVERCISIGKHCPGFFMAVGNHIPPNTPVASACYYNDIYQQLSRR